MDSDSRTKDHQNNVSHEVAEHEEVPKEDNAEDHVISAEELLQSQKFDQLQAQRIAERGQAS